MWNLVLFGKMEHTRYSRSRSSSKGENNNSNKHGKETDGTKDHKDGKMGGG